MADDLWLKALATARRDAAGGFMAADPEAVRKLTRARIDEAITTLREEAETAVAIHNQYARGNRAIRVLPLEPKQDGSGGGFLLLSGGAQLTLLRNDKAGGSLDVTIVVMEGFRRRQVLARRFAPHADGFGTVLWMQQDNSLLMNHELIMKRLLEDITRAACSEE